MRNNWQERVLTSRKLSQAENSELFRRDVFWYNDVSKWQAKRTTPRPQFSVEAIVEALGNANGPDWRFLRRVDLQLDLQIRVLFVS
jgi:hypothetical protein